MLVELAGGAPGEIAFSSHSKQGGHMIKILLTVAVVGSVGSFAGLATALEAPDSKLLSSIAKLEAQCEHRRRMMPPDPRNDCVSRLRSDAQTGSGQGDASAINPGQAAGAGLGIGGGQGNGIGPGNGGGQGNGIGPGNGGGQGKGRR
jgi:hypothetical protein